MRLIGHDPWTEPEDLKLLETLANHGKRWNIISGCIKGRPAVQCRNRFISLQRAGKVSEDGKSSVSTIAGHSPTLDAETTKARVIVRHTQMGLSINVCQQSNELSTLSVGNPSSPSPSISSTSSPSSIDPSLTTWDTISVASSPQSVSMEGLEPTQISTDPQGILVFDPAGDLLN